jgi:glyoxylase-like metal-dependent hydrolase (beta-lactamase superfamily II)
MGVANPSPPAQRAHRPPRPGAWTGDDSVKEAPVKVFALHLGDTRVPYGQFYGGAEGWIGARGVWRMLTDRRHPILVPIYAYLIDHPGAGLLLVDAGINREQAHAHNRYYKGPLLHLLLDEDEYRLPPDQELGAHLARLGYRPGDIRTVILTHGHEDHVGELRAVPHATVVVSREGWRVWEAWNRRTFGLTRHLSPSLAAVRAPRQVTFASGPFRSFGGSHDLLGDGSVVLLPTPGHAPGHLAVLIQLDGYQLLCTGDTTYTLRHLAVEQVRPVAFGARLWARQADSIRRIQRLRRALPELVIAPAHDHSAYGQRYLYPFLAGGGLSAAERRAIKAFEARLFDDDFRLTPDALPRFVPPAAGEESGSVAEAGG